VIGATIILAFGAATSFAQAKSSKRIPISKEAPGEVVRVDTLIRTDTVTITNYHTDTLIQTVTRVDSVLIRPPIPPVHLPAGLYLGIAAGASFPDGSIFIPNSAGGIGQLQLGWQNAKQVIGGRISGTYTGLGQDSRFATFQSNFLGHNNRAQLWTLGTDLKLQAPFARVFGRTPRLAAYAIGGWTYTWFRNLPFRLNNDNLTVCGPNNCATINGNTVINGTIVNGNVVNGNQICDVNGNCTTLANAATFFVGDDSWHGRSGWDVGGGLSLLWGRNEVFVESRVIGFSITNAPSARQVPIMVGFNWY
jgi:hypothetical protein